MCMCTQGKKNCLSCYAAWSERQRDVPTETLTQEIRDLRDIHFLEKASVHASKFSGCQKVRVGSIITLDGQRFYGANRIIPSISCDKDKCNKVLPHDNLPHCVSTIHSEIDAIIRASCSLHGATIYVTRYPCENCARAIVVAGITRVVYGRQQRISKETDDIFFVNNIEVKHVTAFNEEEGAVAK